MPSRFLSASVALALPLALFTAACSSDDDSSGGESATANNSQVTAKTPSTVAAPAPPAAPVKTTFSTTAGHQYTVTVTPKAPDAKATCAGAAVAGALVIPFTVEIHNDSNAQVPQPWLGIGAGPGAGQEQVAAMSVDGQCIDFTFVQNTVPASGTVTYQGSLSNANKSSQLALRLNDAKAGTPTPVAVPLFK